MNNPVFYFKFALLLVYASQIILSKGEQLQFLDEKEYPEFCSTSVPSKSRFCVIPPHSDNEVSKPAKLLIIIPGGLVPTQHYVSLASSVQNLAEEFQLWIGIVSCHHTMNLCNPLDPSSLGLPALINHTIRKIADLSLVPFLFEDIFLAGHSLGGQGAFLFANKYPNIGGVILWASYVSEPLKNYPYPILIVGGELDGTSAKASRLSALFLEFQEFAEQQGMEKAIQSKPVIILQGVDHSDFCQGFFVNGDIQSEVSPKKAVDMIAKLTCTFLKIQIISQNNSVPIPKSLIQEIRNFQTFTEYISLPFLQALKMERSGQWCVSAQEIIASSVPNKFHSMFITAKQTQTLSDFWQEQVLMDVEDGRANITVVSYIPTRFDILKLGNQVSSIEIVCKLFSADMMFNSSQVEHSQTSCKEINENALRYAKQQAPLRTFERYQSSGKSIIVGDDLSQSTMLQFALWSHLHFEDIGEVVEARSSSLSFSMISHDSKGRYFCKLLAPSRVLEWMMTDSLKTMSPSTQGISIVSI